MNTFTINQNGKQHLIDAESQEDALAKVAKLYQIQEEPENITSTIEQKSQKKDNKKKK